MELRSEADSSLVSQVSLSLLSGIGLTALSRRMPGRDEEDEWNVAAGRVEDDEWKVEVTPARRGAAGGEMPLSDSELESMRRFRGRDVEDDVVAGEGMEPSMSEESTCDIGGRVKDDGDSDSAEDSSMRLEWMKPSESDESIRE